MSFEDMNNTEETMALPTEKIGDAVTAAQSFGLDGKQGRSLNTANLMLVALFASGIAGLYLLSISTGPREASADETTMAAQVDAALTQLSSSATSKKDTEMIVDTFYYEARQRQIPMSEMQRNPFVYQKPEEEIKPAIYQNEEKTVAEDPYQNQEADQALATVRKLNLQSVLTGSHGATAMISNNLLCEGQVINGWMVKQIGSREVVLTWKELTYVLKMPR